MPDQDPTTAQAKERWVDWPGPNAEVSATDQKEIAGEFQLLPRTTPRHGGSILMAAMLGLAYALGFDRETAMTEMVQPADPANGQELDLSFGDLPPLN